MKLLVLGGTRFFGLETVRALTARGDEVVVLSRRQPPQSVARAILGERSDPATLAIVREEAGKKPFDAVFDNIAMSGADVSSFLDCLGGRVGHYVLTSTGSVYSTLDHDRTLSEEDWPPDSPEIPRPGEVTSGYGQGKRAAERVLHSRGGETARWTIVRPTIVFGPGDPTGRLAWYVKALLDGSPVGPSDFVFNPAYSADVARLILRILDTPGPSGRIYNAAGREVVSVRDLCVRVQGILRIPGPGVSMPGQPKTSPVLAPAGRFVLSLERALQELRFDPTPLGDWLALTAEAIRVGHATG